MHRDIDRKTYERKSIRGALIGLFIFSFIMIITEAAMIWCQYIDPVPAGMFWLISAIVIAPVIGAVIVLVIRIKEIKEGEEYEAGKY